jgi:hypothetical protein
MMSNLYIQVQLLNNRIGRTYLYSKFQSKHQVINHQFRIFLLTKIIMKVWNYSFRMSWNLNKEGKECKESYWTCLNKMSFLQPDKVTKTKILKRRTTVMTLILSFWCNVVFLIQIKVEQVIWVAALRHRKDIKMKFGLRHLNLRDYEIN